jgi:hypothetical protein
MASDRLKLMYVAPRPAASNSRDFRARWRRYGAALMSEPLFEHVDCYMQSDILSREQVGMPNEAWEMMGCTVEPGGVGTIGLRSPEDLEAFLTAEQSSALQKEELETFGRGLSSEFLACKEHVVMDCGVPRITAYGLVTRQPSCDHDEFSERWIENGPHFIAAKATSQYIARYALNIALEDGRYDGMVELSFASAADAVSFFTGPIDRVLGREAAFIDFSKLHLIFTANHMLYSEPVAPLAAVA